MAEDKEESDFEKLLHDFINSGLDDDESTDTAGKQDSIGTNSYEEDDDELSPEAQAEEERIAQDFDNELRTALTEAKEEAQKEDDQPTLGVDETELAQAFTNFRNAVSKLSKNFLKSPYKCEFEIDDLYPNYKPSVGRLLADDLADGWNRLCQIYPESVAKFSVNSTDEEFLNFAETLKNSDLQLAVISYVEILIDIESCELSYQAKLEKFRESHVKKILYEEYLERKDRERRFIEAVKKKNFPIDAERLITNYFRVAQKDFDGAYQALTNNPAIFAPIDFSRIKPRFFGLIKVTPNDGIRLNLEIGKFLKKLRV